ncbi:peptide chain release factor N(5)-glutamine methyltransferase [Pedobacter sp. KR3-3]|uniref:peptide chain release factor N(5)-glutamine methyltransferase n=1 Tax=Pedobacter albus TaxID=3113905 RepID=A0ABU7I4C9_9SPHI|nr:peptide chain release factor N(5)-glutamine methyltransferase [Pedobacter sp. KR3-3]MEE1944288.1 peptide chain release factor N(5)-glutamine methyltransferase [Pedobacter sp. KR3-3]
MKLKELAIKFNSELSALYDVAESQALFLMALEQLLQIKYNAYLLKKEETLAANDLAKFEDLLTELITGKPIQYIFGEAHFFGLSFKVNPEVLIPRPETEELVDWIIKTVNSPQLAVGNKRLLDIGTGSGCIAIALKKHLPQFEVEGLDIATPSLDIAKENAELNKVEVGFWQQDILQTQAVKSQEPYAIIVSNPPYITQTEKESMHQNVLANEPHRALFVSNEKPLVFYEAIANFAVLNLTEGGLLFFEINEHLGQETVDLLKHKGFNHIELRKDMQGKDRMICGRL